MLKVRWLVIGSVTVDRMFLVRIHPQSPMAAQPTVAMPWVVEDESLPWFRFPPTSPMAAPHCAASTAVHSSARHTPAPTIIQDLVAVTILKHVYCPYPGRMYPMCISQCSCRCLFLSLVCCPFLCFIFCFHSPPPNSTSSIREMPPLRICCTAAYVQPNRMRFDCCHLEHYLNCTTHSVTPHL